MVDGTDNPDDLDAGWEIDEDDLEIATEGEEGEDQIVEEELEPYDSDEATLAYREDEVPEAVAHYLASDKAAGITAEVPRVAPSARAAPVSPFTPVVDDLIVSLPPADETEELPALDAPIEPRSSSLDPDMLFDIGPDSEDAAPAPAPPAAAAVETEFPEYTPEPLLPQEDTGELMGPIRMAAHHQAMIVMGVLMGIAGVAMITTALIR